LENRGRKGGRGRKEGEMEGEGRKQRIKSETLVLFIVLRNFEKRK